MRVKALCATALLVIVFAWQHRAGAYHAYIAENDDEPAHAVSSPMVRDYLASGFRQTPIVFAKEFYSHYPKVAIAHWPPVFHCSLALWMLAAGRSAEAMLSFVGLAEAGVFIRFVRAIPINE